MSNRSRAALWRAPCPDGAPAPLPPDFALLLSITFYEQRSYVEDAIENVAAFTLPTTRVVVHLSNASSAVAASPVGRVLFNDERLRTSGGSGMVTRQHASNVRFAARSVAFSHVALLASSSRLFVGGGVLERHVAAHGYSRIDHHSASAPRPFPSVVAGPPASQVPVDARGNPYFKGVHRDSGWSRDWLGGATLFLNATGRHRMSFAFFEGSFYPRAAALAFVDWLLGATKLANPAAAAAMVVPDHQGVAVEELLWPSFVVERAETLGYASETAGVPFEVHGRTRANRSVFDRDDVIIPAILDLRLGKRAIEQGFGQRPVAVTIFERF